MVCLRPSGGCWIWRSKYIHCCNAGFPHYVLIILIYCVVQAVFYKLAVTYGIFSEGTKKKAIKDQPKMIIWYMSMIWCLEKMVIVIFFAIFLLLDGTLYVYIHESSVSWRHSPNTVLIIAFNYWITCGRTGLATKGGLHVVWDYMRWAWHPDQLLQGTFKLVNHLDVINTWSASEKSLWMQTVLVIFFLIAGVGKSGWSRSAFMSLCRQAMFFTLIWIPDSFTLQIHPNIWPTLVFVWIRKHKWIFFLGGWVTLQHNKHAWMILELDH